MFHANLVNQDLFLDFFLLIAKWLKSSSFGFIVLASALGGKSNVLDVRWLFKWHTSCKNTKPGSNFGKGGISH